MMNAGNAMSPSLLRIGADHMNYIFYEVDPGVPVQDPTNLSVIPNKKVYP